MHPKALKLIFNYKKLFAYLTAVTFICMQYIVSHQTGQLHEPTKKEMHTINKRSIDIPNIHESINLRSFLNIDYEKESEDNLVTSTNNKRLSKRNISKLKFDKPFSSFDLRRLRNQHKYYDLKNSTIVYNSQIMQDKILLHLLNTSVLNDRKASSNGIFVEVGAYDGETWSNTLHLERFKNWTGLLIEPSTENYHKLIGKHRNAYSINSCVCAGRSSLNSSFIEAGPFSITMNEAESKNKVMCHPLSKILSQFFRNYFPNKRSQISGKNLKNKSVVDYMSLDIEGFEKETIKTFPWHRYQINLINIEYNQNKETYQWLKNFLGKFGYLETLVDDVWYQDLYLAHKSIYNKLNLNVSKVSDFMKLNNV